MDGEKMSRMEEEDNTWEVVDAGIEGGNNSHLDHYHVLLLSALHVLDPLERVESF